MLMVFTLIFVVERAGLQMLMAQRPICTRISRFVCVADRVAVCTRDGAGVPTLLALPSDRPSLRQEAVSVELMLMDAIAEPPGSLEL